MGSSAECCPKSIDASAGGLVWVRRRNGSWWPGRIMGQEELLESSTASPRAGTPVKLLGRDDASVDWYNLEKSKRVKAFRCGEYDECIEKAKAAAANNSKKVARYARREDAILHALEIESASLGNSRIDKEDGIQHLIEEPPISPHPHQESENVNKDGNSSEEYSSSDPELSESDPSFEEANAISAFKEQSVPDDKHQILNDSEDDGTQGAKRMRGLDDLGTGAVQSSKRKRSQMAHVREFLKKKSRRRRLMKVLETTAMVSVPVVCEDIPSPNGSDIVGTSGSKAMLINSKSDDAGVLCENGTSINASKDTCASSSANCKLKENAIPSISGSPENGVLDSLFDVPFVTEEKNSAGLSPIVSLASQIGAGEKSSQNGQVGTMSLGNDEFNESGSRSSGNTEIHDVSQRLEKGTSKWQSKGKRNSRHSRQSKKCDSGKPVGTNDKSDSCLAAEFQLDEFRGWSRNIISHGETPTKGRTTEVLNPQRLLPYRQSRFTVNPKYESSDFPLRHHKPPESLLYNVNLEVKSSYRPQHVPYISLVSKLNGRPITGHPVTVEVLDDGFCSQLLLSTSECYSSSYDNTNAEDMVNGTRPSSCGKVPTKHPPRTSPSKSSKSKKSTALSKKMRKLSSLTGSHKQSQEKKRSVQKLIGPVVACVPLKVVFSRINEAVRAGHRITGTSNG
ncbi:PREDICTED: uncharacterized protein At1g51745-like isoform X2 [Ipomoea nil]|uniref:uncharacterized protein At1g51745-like isoform X2 n=1 Tax=Ipomoea nil TaxID=35883 RepID=UPI0009014000|nr:PREDICTED: uncharacterized protein At1g51745-like isoform X2 [Ipomoea nil]